MGHLARRSTRRSPSVTSNGRNNESKDTSQKSKASNNRRPRPSSLSGRSTPVKSPVPMHDFSDIQAPIRLKCQAPNLQLESKDTDAIEDWCNNAEAALYGTFPDARCAWKWLDPSLLWPTAEQVQEEMGKPYEFADFKQEWDYPDDSGYKGWLVEMTRNQKAMTSKLWKSAVAANGCEEKTRSTDCAKENVNCTNERPCYLVVDRISSPLRPTSGHVGHVGHFLTDFKDPSKGYVLPHLGNSFSCTALSFLRSGQRERFVDQSNSRHHTPTARAVVFQDHHARS